MNNPIPVEAIDDSDAILNGKLPEVLPVDYVMDASARSTLRSWFVLGLVLPLLGMAPLLYLQLWRLIEQQAFWFFPASIALGCLLFWRTGRYRPASLTRGRVATALLWFGLATAAIAIYWYSPWAMHVALVVVLTAWALGAFGGTSWTRVLIICSLFVVTVPLPSGRNIQVSNTLQSIAAWCCNGLLDAVSIPNIIEGDSMQIAESSFRVSVACAGADSVFAFFAIGIALLAIFRSSFLPGMITLLTIPLFSIFANVLRLLAIAMGAVYFKTDLTVGWLHFAVAILVFAFSLLSFWFTHKSIVALLEPIDGKAEKTGVIKFYQVVTKWPEYAEGQSVVGPTRAIWNPGWATLGGPFGRLPIANLDFVLFGHEHFRQRYIDNGRK